MNQSAPLDALLPLASSLSIAHHLPGRIRLKLADYAADSLGEKISAAKTLEAALAKSPAIHKVSLNILARSCTIAYDAKTIPFAAWEDLVKGQNTSARDVLLNAII